MVCSLFQLLFATSTPLPPTSFFIGQVAPQSILAHRSNDYLTPKVDNSGFRQADISDQDRETVVLDPSDKTTILWRPTPVLYRDVKTIPNSKSSEVAQPPTSISPKSFPVQSICRTRPKTTFVVQHPMSHQSVIAPTNYRSKPLVPVACSILEGLAQSPFFPNATTSPLQAYQGQPLQSQLQTCTQRINSNISSDSSKVQILLRAGVPSNQGMLRLSTPDKKQDQRTRRRHCHLSRKRSVPVCPQTFESPIQPQSKTVRSSTPCSRGRKNSKKRSATNDCTRRRHSRKRTASGQDDVQCRCREQKVTI